MKLTIKDKIVSAIFAGMYIGLGGTIYLLCPDKMIGSMFFSTGIFLVFMFKNYLFTRIVPLSAATKDYGIVDIVIAWVGNLIGGTLYSFAITNTRLVDKLAEKIVPVVTTKVEDTFLSLIIMGFFCAVLVSFSVIACYKNHDNKGIAVFFYFVMVTAFIFLGFDHIVANFFYFSLYSFTHGFLVSMIPCAIAVTIGNALGGLFIGYFEKCPKH